ncbi:anti-repressor SinI family protein [Virgibacillus sp. C22-A2]|uniref:Anti-repressor SinI family protein n=1 Tax=Virgibacillus tibetensis TaxID=3042313 RepID=A0ABU6KD87_9BACI|nr:anti-repressor SinI family protein [Virgibacillus sp. C22-A2]
MTTKLASTGHNYAYDREWLYLITLAKQSGLSAAEVRQFLRQSASKEKSIQHMPR